MAKTIYHSELVKLGAINVRIKSDVTPSKFKDKSPYCTLEVNGEERNYTIESQACADVLHANKGRLVMLEAAGSREEATIKVLAAGASQEQPPAAPVRQPIQVPAAQASAPAPVAAPHVQAQSRRTPMGQTLGMAINNACASLTAQGAELNPRRVFELASDILRLSYYLEEGHLAPTYEARLKADYALQHPDTTPQAPAPKQLSQIPPAEPPEPETDEVPF